MTVLFKYFECERTVTNNDSSNRRDNIFMYCFSSSIVMVDAFSQA
jgi:hypothetical protein